MMKRLISSAFALLFVALMAAQMQAPQINFETKEYDFGEIKEVDGPVTFVFKFNNIGNEPLILSNVKPSCGCTTPKWSKEPILPNGSGEIAVTYNPRNRPGSFRKSITVTNNTATPSIYLIIKGKVVAREKTVEEKYPFPLGVLRVKKSHLSFFNLTNTAVKTNKITVYNPTDKPVTVSFEDLPAHVTSSPVKVAGGKEGSIQFTYDASKKNDWGFVSDDVYATVNGKLTSTKIKLSATITEDFSSLSKEDRLNAPKASLSVRKIDFGTAKRGETVTKTMTVTNKGKSPLKIHSVKSTSSIVKCDVSVQTIPVGETATLTITLDTGRTKGRQYKTINIISNDPTSPNLTVTLSGSVK